MARIVGAKEFLVSRLEIKSFDEDKRIIEGIASTPTPDRMSDIVEPKGAEFNLPIPLLWQHDSKQPIGEVFFAKPTKEGIPFKAKIAKATQSRTLMERLDEVWESIKIGLVKATSIGFRPLEYAFMDNGGIHFSKWEWLELSVVTIPAQAEATITEIKTIDQGLRTAAALGQKTARGSVVRVDAPPGATGPQQTSQPTETTGTMNIREQIQALENKRAATAARIDALMQKAANEGVTFDAAEQEEYDTAVAELTAIDAHLKRMSAHEKLILAGASRVEQNAGQEPNAPASQAPAQRAVTTRVPAGEGVVKTRKDLPKGIAFTRYAISMMLAKGNLHQALSLSKQWDTSTPEVGLALQYAVNKGSSKLHEEFVRTKAAVDVGTTTDSDWANPLVQYENMASEFIELLRPLTILGRIQGFRRVPFYVRIPRQTAGVSGSFVGENAPKPVGKLSFDSLTMEPLKAAMIVVMTQELVRFSNPAAETLVRDDMARGIAQYLDERFVDPQYVGVANVSPASITNQATAVSSTGTTIAAVTTDIESAMNGFVSNNLNLQGAVWLMAPAVALSLSLKRTSQDVYAWPELNVNGGTWFGLPVITSNSVVLAGSPSESYIILLDPSEILLADDGGIDIDMSMEASVQMSDTPAAGATSLVSLWQNNLVGLRAEKFINWKTRRTNSQVVAIIRYNLSQTAV